MIDAEPTKRTLGVDLASQPAKTGICVVEWGGSGAKVMHLATEGSDEVILDLHHSCNITGIDMPFGWPGPFVGFLLGNPSADPEEWSDTWKKTLRFRRTDFAVHEITGRWPLSVSSDRIAIPTMRCRGLLTEMGVTDLSGDGRVFEVYPAAALWRWGLPHQKYKRKKGRAILMGLVRDLLNRCPWLEVDSATRKILTESDDAFDALVCALVARAAALGLTVPPESEDLESARREGWIHLPVEGALGRLVGAEITGSVSKE